MRERNTHRHSASTPYDHRRFVNFAVPYASEPYFTKSEVRLRIPNSFVIPVNRPVERHPGHGLRRIQVIAFGREAWRNRKRGGQAKLETFTFLGFTRYCGENSKGYLQVWRETAGKRIRAKLQQIKQELRARMHAPAEATGKWPKRVVLGYYQYRAVPGNLQQLARFRWRLARLWRFVLRRRSQKSWVTWDEIRPVFDRRIPAPRTLHPYPHVRFDARIQGKSRMR